MKTLKYFSLFFLAIAFASHSTDQSPEMQSVLNATHAMSTSGYTTMSAITLILYNNFLQWSTLNITGFTIFAPTDSAFISDISGKRDIPSSETIFIHYSTAYLSLREFGFWPEIPTISLQHNLIITRSFVDSEISICYVKVSTPPIYDDGYIIVYGIKQVFNISFAKEVKSSSNRIVHSEL
ncbi:unnamed protein product [Withania somnifera]